MADIATKFGLGGGGGGTSLGNNFSDPRKMLKLQTIPYLDNYTSVTRASTTADFWTGGVAVQGVQLDTDFAADTYKDLLDISSGAGLVTHIIGPAVLATQTTTFRVTVDGTAYVISVVVSQDNKRATLSPGAFDNEWITTNKRRWTSQFQLESNTQIITPAYLWNLTAFRVMGTPLLEYTTSLKVEVKNSAAITGTGSQERRCGMMYYDGFKT